MSDTILEAIGSIIQEDVGRRGLRTDPQENLITTCAADFAGACRHVAETINPRLLVVTGFFIPQAEPPAAETDGPLGAVFLARALVPLDIPVTIAADSFCRAALASGLRTAGLDHAVEIVTLPSPTEFGSGAARDLWRVVPGASDFTHLIAIERVGPSHTRESVEQQAAADRGSVDAFIREVPADHHDRCHTMRGRDITTLMSPAHLLFDKAGRPGSILTTIGIGDGGNEIGMGKVPWSIIRRNIPNGGLVACRVPTDYLIVCGISNWGAYGLAAGVRYLRGVRVDGVLFDPGHERSILQSMVERGPLVDGVTGRPTVTVDGLSFERYAAPHSRIAELLTGGHSRK